MPPLVIAAGISAAGAIGGAAISSRGAGKAADVQATAAEQAGKLGTEAAAKSNELLKAIYEGDLAKLQPYFDAGYEGLTQLTEGLKSGGYFSETYPYFKFDAEDFQTEPGYEFRLAEGQKALERSAAARGGALSGRAIKEATRYNQGFASNEYSNAYNRALNKYQTNLNTFLTEKSDRWNRLATLAGYGQWATGTAASMGERYGAATSANTMEGARLGSEALTGAANARASGYVSQGNIWGNAVNTVGNIASDYYANRYAPTAGTTGGNTQIGAGTITPQNVEANEWKVIYQNGKMYVTNGSVTMPVGG